MEKRNERIMKIGKDWICFITYQLICVGYYLFSMMTINCEPCPPNVPCPPCISEGQIFSFWAGIIGIVVFIIWKLVKRKSQPLINSELYEGWHPKFARC